MKLLNNLFPQATSRMSAFGDHLATAAYAKVQTRLPAV